MPAEDRRRSKRWYTPFQAVWDGPYVPVYAVATVGSVRSLSSDPRWREKVSSGLDATLPYSNTKISCYKVPGICWAQPKPNYPPASRRRYSYVDGGVPNFFALPTDLWAQANGIAATKVIKDIRGVQTSVSGLTIIGELRETVQMLRSPAQALRKASGLFLFKLKDRVQRDKFLRRNQVKWEGVLANEWLEFTFGLKPLLRDVDDIVGAALDIDLEGITRVRGVGSNSSSQIIQRSGGTLIGANWEHEEVWIFDAFVKYVCGVRETDNTDRTPLERLRAKAGLDWSEVVPAAYELIPWSFLLDYFISVGDVLSTAFVSLRDVAWSSKTTVGSTHVHRQRDRLQGVTDTAAILYFERQKPEYVGDRHEIVRSKTLPSGSIDALRFRIPPVGAKWLNMSALATQLFLRKP